MATMDWARNLLRGVSGHRLDGPLEERLSAWHKLPVPDYSAAHLRTRYVVVDIEASGLDQRKDRLISIGAVAVNGGTIHCDDAFEVVLRQDEASQSANILIHGIGAEAQRDGADPPAALLRFLEFAGHAPLVAYHAFFDQGMIDAACERYLGERPRFVWHDLAWLMPALFPDRIDAIVGLDDWLAQFSIGNYRRHNAVSDSLATAQLLQIALAKGAAAGFDASRHFTAIEKARRATRRIG